MQPNQVVSRPSRTGQHLNYATKTNDTGKFIFSCPDPTHSHEKGLVLFKQFLGLSSEFWEANQNQSM